MKPNVATKTNVGKHVDIDNESVSVPFVIGGEWITSCERVLETVVMTTHPDIPISKLAAKLLTAIDKHRAGEMRVQDNGDG